MTKVEKLKEQIATVIKSKLKEDLTCEDVLKLAQAISELERNDTFKSLTSLATCGFSGFDGNISDTSISASTSANN